MTEIKLPKLVVRSSKRVGRGIGSGKGGHTSGRGNKGQKARGKVAINFEGTKFKKSLIKRLPLLRGKGKFNSWNQRVTPIKLTSLSNWPAKEVVSLENLIKFGMVKSGEMAKIVADGEIKVALTIAVPASASALSKITKAGGKVE